MFNLAFSPRYWAKRQRRASFGSTISNFCMLATKSVAYAIRFRDGKSLAAKH